MEVARYSPSGEYLGVVGADGRIKIWDTSTSILKQEIVPSMHLTSTCTCLEWAPAGNQVIGKKKRRKRIMETDGNVLAMGTETGGLLMYSATKAQLLSQQKDFHSGRMTGLSWSSSTLMLYSCGEDGYIHEWDPETTTAASRWKGDKSGLSTVRVFGNRLLSAGRGITLWDLESKTPAITFTGHPSVITQIEVIEGTDYFVTMCHTERHLKIWSLNEKNSVLSLTVPEPPQSFAVQGSSEGQVAVASTTQKGVLHVFRHKLNGPVKKPVLPTATLKVMESSDNSKQISVLTSYISSDDNSTDMSMLLSYGNWLRLRFEKFHINSLERDTAIKREYSKTKTTNKQVTLLPEVDLAEVPNSVRHLQQSSENLVSKSSDVKAKKRKNAGQDEEIDVPLSGELPMEERLTNLTIESSEGGAIPSSSNMGNLLSQGLHSKDARILQSVLSKWDDELISTTVRSLPVQLLIPLLNEIKRMLGGKAQQNYSLLKWLKNIFKIHSAYLMFSPSNEELLDPFLNLLRSRETLYPQMCQLKGKLELIKGNIQAKDYKSEQPNEALLVFQDESSDEEREDETFLPSESEGFLESDEEDDLGVDEDDSSEDDNDNDSENGSDAESGQSNFSVENLKRTKIKKCERKLENATNRIGDDSDYMDADG